MNQFNITLAIIFFGLCQFADAQNILIKDCGTPPPGPEWKTNILNRENNVQTSTLYLIKLYVTVFADDNGSNQAAGDSQVIRQIENMRDFYAPHNICFVLAGIQHVNNTDLNYQNVDLEWIELGPFMMPEMVNILIHKTLVNNQQTLNGSAYNIPNSYISMDGSAIASISNRSTLSHEMGHAFGLLHTHETAGGEENVARSGDCANCNDNGDYLCDTEADPNLDNMNFVDINCNYTGNATDECGWLYNPNTRNIMAYGNRDCRNILTYGQGALCRAIIENTPFLWVCVATHDILVLSDEAIGSGEYYLIAKNTITISTPSYQINGSSQAKIISNKTTLYPGVRFTPGVNGIIRLHQNALCQ